jgi:ribokinase
MRILNFGSLNIDHVYRVRDFVRPGETIDSQGYERFAGGKGLNQSIALARAGAEVFHAGCVGTDGLWLRDTLEEAGVDVAHVNVVDEPTGHAIIQVNEAGENAIVLYGGANRKIDPARVGEVLTRFVEGDLLLLQNEVGALPEMMALAAARNIRVAFNAAPMTSDVSDYPLENVDFFVINETEAAALVGKNAPAEMLSAMRARFPGAATVLTLGAEGSMYADSAQQLSCAAEKVNPVDTTAAGDTFTGYFLAEIALGNDPESALHWATKAAAICVTRHGAGISIPQREELGD